VEDVIRNFIKNIHLSNKVANKMIQYIEKRTQLDIKQIASAEFIKNTALPGLVIHDQHDNEVPVSCADEIYNSFDNGTLYISKNLGHRRILRDSRIIEKIVNFIKHTT
jgi:hypothetical protein